MCVECVIMVYYQQQQAFVDLVQMGDICGTVMHYSIATFLPFSYRYHTSVAKLLSVDILNSLLTLILSKVEQGLHNFTRHGSSYPFLHQYPISSRPLQKWHRTVAV